MAGPASESSPTGNFDIVVNPEFLREGTALDDFLNPDRIVLGVDSERARELMLQIFHPILEQERAGLRTNVIITDTRSAEIIKHSSNAFLATKISFINMVANLCEATGADVETVPEGMGLDPRIGPQFLRAGIGYGGYCLPKDIQAFTHIAEEHGVDFALLREVERINHDRIDLFIAKLRRAIWVIKGKTLAVWGLAFKGGTDDVREAPSLSIVARLVSEGAQLRLYDPKALDQFHLSQPVMDPSLVYCSSPEEAADNADAVLILTEWPEFLAVDWPALKKRMAAPLIVDGRNLINPDTVRALGFDYYGTGRG